MSQAFNALQKISMSTAINAGIKALAKAGTTKQISDENRAVVIIILAPVVAELFDINREQAAEEVLSTLNESCDE